MRCWTCAWIEQTTNTPHLHFLEFWGGKRKTTEEEHVIDLPQVDVVILHKYDTPAPRITFSRSFEVGNEESRTEEIEFDNLYHHPRISFSRTLKWDMENKNWKHANQIAAGAWDVEHVHELNKLPTPHLHFLEFWGGKKKTTEEENVIWLAAGLRDVILRKYDTPAPTITFSGVLR